MRHDKDVLKQIWDDYNLSHKSLRDVTGVDGRFIDAYFDGESGFSERSLESKLLEKAIDVIVENHLVRPSAVHGWRNPELDIWEDKVRQLLNREEIEKEHRAYITILDICMSAKFSKFWNPERLTVEDRMEEEIDHDELMSQMYNSIARDPMLRV